MTTFDINDCAVLQAFSAIMQAVCAGVLVFIYHRQNIILERQVKLQEKALIFNVSSEDIQNLRKFFGDIGKQLNKAEKSCLLNPELFIQNSSSYSKSLDAAVKNYRERLNKLELLISSSTYEELYAYSEIANDCKEYLFERIASTLKKLEQKQTINKGKYGLDENEVFDNNAYIYYITSQLDIESDDRDVLNEYSSQKESYQELFTKINTLFETHFQAS